jgi:hypothetical protein
LATSGVLSLAAKSAHRDCQVRPRLCGTVTVSVVLAACTSSGRFRPKLTGTQAGSGVESSQARVRARAGGLLPVGQWGMGRAPALLFWGPGWHRHVDAAPSGPPSRLPGPPLALAVPGHWHSTLKVPTTKSGGDPHHQPETVMQPSCALRVTCMYQIEVVIGVGLRLALKYY